MTVSDNAADAAPATSTSEPSSLTSDQAADKLANLLGAAPNILDNRKDEDQDADNEPEGEVEGDDEATDPDDESEGPEETEQEEAAAVTLEDDTEIDLDGERITFSELKLQAKSAKELRRKLTHDAEMYKADREMVEAKAQTVVERAQQLQQERETFLALAQEFLPPVPQRPTVSPSEDPMAWVEFSAAKEQYEAKVQRLNEVARQRQQYAEQQKQQQNAELPKIVAQEREKLLARYPSLKDAKVAEKTKAEMASVIAEKYGFAPDEIANVADHRAVAMMLDLLDYQRIKAAAPAAKAKLESKPPLVKPAKRTSPQAKAQSERQDLHARLGRTGRRDDAVAILKALDL